MATPALAPLYLGAGRDGWRLGFSGLDNATLRERFAALVRAFD